MEDDIENFLRERRKSWENLRNIKPQPDSFSMKVQVVVKIFAK